MNSKSRGVSILEILIASAIIGISVVGVITSLKVFLVFSLKNTEDAQSSILLEESLEVVQYLRDKGWDQNIKDLVIDQDYYIYWDGIDYSITDIPQLENGKFTRKIQFKEVMRDNSSDDIVTTGGYTDSGTKKVLVDISWQSHEGNKNINSEFLIHNVYQN